MTTSKYLRHAALCAALATCCALALSGCVLIPIPTAIADPEPFTPETLSVIAVGRTTQDQVRALFADWKYTTDDGVQTAHINPLISDDGRYWIFALHRQMGDVAFAGLFLYYPVPIPVLKGVEDNYQNYWVLVEFDEAALVTAFRITRERAPCERGGVCYRNGHLLVLANETGVANMQGSDRCAVYTYARTDFDAPATVSDGSQVDQIFGKTSFLRDEITAGQSTISALIEGSAETSDVSVTCVGGETFYVELDRIKKRVVALQVGESTGAREVAKRLLVERVVPVSAPRPTRGEIENSELNIELAAPVLWPPPELHPIAVADPYRRAQALVAMRNPEAWPLLCEAADSGDARAQMELGFWQRADLAHPNEFTEPLDKDNRLAYVWYRLAELNGGDASDAREYLGNQLTAEELVQAEMMVRERRLGDCPLRTVGP